VNILIKNKGYFVLNVDITLIAQAPKIASYADEIIVNIASDLECGVDEVNVKATTTENLGFEGREEGIACQTIVLIDQYK
jgi:2-C-methyl-D-erythritol 2,4-cyclodiphosphate synthase